MKIKNTNPIIYKGILKSYLTAKENKMNINNNIAISPPWMPLEQKTETNSFYTIRKEYNEQIYGKISQIDFAQSMTEACKLVANLIHEKKGFYEIVKDTGTIRNKIAIEQKTKEAKKFGILRDKAYTTPLCDEYSSMVLHLSQISEDDPHMEWNLFSQEDKGPKIGFRLGKCQNGNIVKLSKYAFYNRDTDSKKNALIHTTPENIKVALEESRFYFEEILRLDPKVHRSTIENEYIPSFHWWFIQATAYNRGTGACGEIITSALSLEKFGRPIKWREDVFPDRFALTTSLEEFIAMYLSLQIQ